MAGNEGGRRRFVTRLDVDLAARSGSAITLGPRDVITDEAAQRARDLDVTVTAQPAVTETTQAAPPASPTSSPDANLRPLVREAVIAELGTEPAHLEDALDKVFGTTGR